jgi:hypothetical protein
MTIIEITPHHNGWKVFEAPGVEPVFPEKRQAINHAQNRASFRSGEIPVFDSTGDVERTVTFSEGEERWRKTWFDIRLRSDTMRLRQVR